MLSMCSLKIILKHFFKLKYLSNNQHYTMIKFGSTTVEVSHCTLYFNSPEDELIQFETC
jgi:hypothetical protein